jgi:hypothetical protein
MAYPEITFKDFATLARNRGHTAESLAERFRGTIEEPREFFERVMTCKYKREDRSYVVIPYRSVIEFYLEELHYFGESHAKHRRCACRCGAPVFDRKKWASPACKKRIQRNGERKAVTDIQKRVLQVPDFIDAKPGQKRVMATSLLPDQFREI